MLPFWTFRELMGLCKRSRDPSVYLCTHGMAAIVSSAKSERCSLMFQSTQGITATIITSGDLVRPLLNNAACES